MTAPQTGARPRQRRPLSAPLPLVALIGTYVPRACGIATFTRDLRAALGDPGTAASSPLVVALDRGDALDPATYPPEVRYRLRRGDETGRAAVMTGLAAAEVRIVSLQHEFGIFGGHAGREVLDLVAALPAPLVTTFHTVLARPQPLQGEIVRGLVEASSRVVVMTRRGRDLLHAVYGVPEARIAVIPHGVPDVPFRDPDAAKPALGLGGRAVILNFGLLSPNKGLEAAIDALARVVEAVPEAVLVIAGRTHPEVRRRHGEAYREALLARTAALGLGDHVRFIDRYLEADELAALVAAADVFVTPYGNAAQITSGTLAYAAAAGVAVISTPYEHARELLAEGRGALVPFGDQDALATTLRALLVDDDARQAMRRRAWLYGRQMAWPAVGARYRGVFAEVLAETAGARPRSVLAETAGARPRSALPAVTPRSLAPRSIRVPSPALSPPAPLRSGSPASPASPASAAGAGMLPLAPVARHYLERLWTPLGLYQHAIGRDPDPRHGFCTDDVARALLVESLQAQTSPQALAGRGPEAGLRRALAFLEAAFVPATGRFRNLRAVDGEWLETVGSEDAHGRALEALGALIGDPPDEHVGARARALFLAGLPAASSFEHLRPRAHAALGCAAALAAGPDARLTAALSASAGYLSASVAGAPDRLGWPWPEPVVTYDNSVLPAALIAAGTRTGREDWLIEGRALLVWLSAAQMAPEGHLRPIGNAGWWPRGGRPAAFDQQPLEAAGIAEAAWLALRATAEPRWATLMERAYAWFLGANDLGLPLADVEDGSCRDGLQPDGVNANRGAESTLAWLLTAERVRALRRPAAVPAGPSALGRRLPGLRGDRTDVGVRALDTPAGR